MTPRERWLAVKSHAREALRRQGWTKRAKPSGQLERERWDEIKQLHPGRSGRITIGTRTAPPKPVVTGTQRALMHHSTRAKRARADRDASNAIPLAERQAATREKREVRSR